MAMRRRYQRVLLPGEREGRRDFIKKGLVGAVLLAAGGGTYLATRRTRPVPGLGPLQVLTPEEATVVLAVANRMVPERVGFPRPLEVGVPRKVDALVAGLHPGTQKEIRRLLNLFEGALAGAIFEAQFRTFTACSPWEQDERLRGWAQSRVTLRRSGFRALKKLVEATYYSSPETWPAIGYPGPPPVPPPVPAERPPAPGQEEQGSSAPAPKSPASPRQAEAAPHPAPATAPREVESIPTPRSGVPIPTETER
jgi:hypothetical protein